VPILNVGATVACAVANATGNRVQSLPLTPPRVLALLSGTYPPLDFRHIDVVWRENIIR
jgi:hypothetical protein